MPATYMPRQPLCSASANPLPASARAVRCAGVHPARCLPHARSSARARPPPARHPASQGMGQRVVSKKDPSFCFDQPTPPRATADSASCSDGTASPTRSQAQHTDHLAALPPLPFNPPKHGAALYRPPRHSTGGIGALAHRPSWGGGAMGGGGAGWRHSSGGLDAAGQGVMGSMGSLAEAEGMPPGYWPLQHASSTSMLQT